VTWFTVTPNPSLHRTRYGGFRPPARAGELKRLALGNVESQES
jgi:hypothetical protein